MSLLKRSLSAITRNSRLGMLFLAFAGACSAALGQTAPYILPYTMSTFAGPHAQYTIGAACGAYIALDIAGDGCLASVASVGADPHDIRVDGQGNVYWIDNSEAVIHKISAVTGRMTIFLGSITDSTVCSSSSTTYGDGCVANDGAGNAGTPKNPLTPTYPYYTAKSKSSRGLAIGANGDLFYADYNGNYDHKISAATGILSLVAGSGVANASNPPATGQPGTSQVNGSRGIGVDPNGNVYIADTGDGVLRVVPSGIGSVPGVASPVAGFAYDLTVYNPSTSNVKSVVNNIPVAQVVLNALEDVQCDSNGNVYIADTGNGVVRVLYAGKGNIPGVSNPVTGNVYVVAGYNAGYSTASNPYPSGASAPTFPATTVTISDRKIALDSRNNLYIADSGSNVVWFVDNTTGNIRVLAGNYGAAAGTAAPGCAASTDTVGDGCPGPLASLYVASDMGTDPDNLGNLYITDAENGVVANSRLRKLLSGLNFPAVARGVSVTQTLLVHFGIGDSMAAANAFVIKGVGTATTDYVAGTPQCTLQTDLTDDCTLAIAFTPTQPGNDTSTLSITSTLGGTNSYLLTGTGTLPAITIDPGSVSVLTTPTATSNAQGVAVDGQGNVYTADTGNNRVLLYTASTGVTTTFAGTGIAGYGGDTGLATLATLKTPRAVAIDSSGSVYIADTGNNVIRKVNSGGVISTYAGGGTACNQTLNTRGDGCPALQATFSSPSGLAADNLGGLYVADTGNNVIREIGVLGDVATIAGGATSVCSAAIDVFGDGCSASAANLKSPTGLTFDAAGSNLIVADTGDNIVRKIYLANSIASVQGASYITSTVLVYPVTLIAGTGAAGDVVDTNSTGVLSQLSGPTGVAVSPSGAVYIADTGNSAIRVVSPSGGISTIVGVLGAPGTGSTPGSAASVQLTSPASVAVTPTGTLQIADAGNNRLLTDLRSQVAFNFGRTNEGFASPTQNFVESSIGVVAATLPTTLLTQSAPTQTQFALGPVTGSTGCVSGTFAIGATCILQATFTPTVTGSFTDTYTEVGSNVAAGDPSITLVGVGAILTKTTSAVAQTSPTGTSQFGATATVTATITPASCNTAAPACYPTGTVRFIIDGGNPGAPIAITGSATSGLSAGSQVIAGLAVGAHTVACNYSGDSFYAASTCGTITITVVQGGTTSTLTVTNNNGTQFNGCIYPYKDPNSVTPVTRCGYTVLTATVVSNTIATAFPTGTVSFYVGTTPLGVGQVGANNGIATFSLQEELNADDSVFSNNTLAPGTYSLNCSYSGSANFATSNCAGVTFTVLPSPVTLTLTPRGCQLASIPTPGTSTPSIGVPCAAPVFATSGAVQVDTAQGSTTDASIFLVPSNSFAGTVTFSCSGLPAAGACTFLPSSITFAAGTGAAVPMGTDMTLWTDVPSGTAVTSIRTDRHDGIAFAVLLGWPLTLAGFAGVIRFRRKLGHRVLSLIAFGLLLTGTSILASGCAGPGAQIPNLTPAGTYPITVTATGGGITSTTVVSFVVGAPGVPGQE